MFKSLLLLFPLALAAQDLDHEHNHGKLSDRVHQALAVSPESVLADIGAGAGDWTIPLARKAKRVYAVDIDNQSALPRLRQRLEKENLTNVEVIHSEPDDPKLPEGSLDAALVMNAYHEFRNPEAMLKHIHRALKPGGVVVIVESAPVRTRQRPREVQVRNHALALEIAIPEFQAAGFVLEERMDEAEGAADSEHTRWLARFRKR
ncbi:MAG: class I SAM-dependent methyltransferase [Bryobacteraceae bacterium]|nr:class I SAM-dependent methyltransferase [Bryobacteraceae bacterium]